MITINIKLTDTGYSVNFGTTFWKPLQSLYLLKTATFMGILC